MAIQKKSLISALKTTKKANIASATPEVSAEKVASMKVVSSKRSNFKAVNLKSMRKASTRSMRRSTKSMRAL